jgi:hypothetical protein
VIATPPPDRFDCHYLITAWRHEVPGPASDPTPDEHHLLYGALTELLRNAPLNPTRFYGKGSMAAAAWLDAKDWDIPTTALSVDGFQRFGELWHGMGTEARWKPALHVVATLPVIRDPIPEGPMVTTQITEYRIFDGRKGEQGVAPERWIIIGGTVTDTAHPLPDGRPAPVPNAWVHLEEVVGGKLSIQTLTDSSGRYLLQWPLRVWPRPLEYRLRWGADGIGAGVIPSMYVPSETGNYDLKLP